ncbi:hypothetical protein CMK18_04100 [Candidatus Poribacteria bacterium]|nr:hypothetical protein [Candidatus Poribacteria bacterium]
MTHKIRHICFGIALFYMVGVNLGEAKTDIDKLLESAVGVWLFDEGNGEMAKDISKEGNHGKLIKAPKWINGKFGKALEFNGKDNCVQTEQKLLDNLKEFTLSCWIKTGKMTGGRIGLVGQNNSPEFGFNNPKTLWLWTPAGDLQAPWKHGAPSNDWHHVAGVASKKHLRVYVDGEVTEGGGGGPFGSSPFNVNIGGCGIWDANGNWFTGAMDEVAIFHSALSDEDIKAIANQGITGLLSVNARGRLPIIWADLKEKQ